MQRRQDETDLGNGSEASASVARRIRKRTHAIARSLAETCEGTTDQHLFGVMACDMAHVWGEFEAISKRFRVVRIFPSLSNRVSGEGLSDARDKPLQGRKYRSDPVSRECAMRKRFDVALR
jgi:hypothetical protein